ncbi:S8 family serine peptidase [Floricoccus penangensis]|uniref:S8 family serine peptidase n=1 Tax=Floricoccus penangensis TaxID=1859475 RepID=UPI0020406DCA|nr:S8 family serine peptidase [Floricoccus penangensis]URZ86665.1 S8 family serine peptidase [Floricoccus penangensis]
MKKEFKKSAIIAASFLLLSTPILQAATVYAEDSKKESSVSSEKDEKALKEYLQNQSQLKNEDNTKSFYDAVKEQLKLEGIIKEGGSETEIDQNQRIRVIVQLGKNAAIDKVGTSSGNKRSIEKIEKEIDSVKGNQKSVKSEVEKIAGAKARRSFGYLVNGFSIDIKLADYDKIKDLNGVLAVTPAQVYYPTDTDANSLGQVQKVWEEHQLKGEGMVVSIIDTGIDSSHKDLYLSDKSSGRLNKDSAAALGKGKYFTEKVPFGYNYADGSTDIVDTTGSMHGQHVAGIAASNGNVKGVAPEAQLLAMKVFSNNTDYKGCFSDDVIAAIEDSVKLGADVINMSLGSVTANTDIDDPQSQAIKKASDAGVISVISAGNSGTSGSTGDGNPKNQFDTPELSTTGSPGVTPEALTVASSENSKVKIKTIKEIKGLVKFDSVPDLNDGSTTVFTQAESDYSILKSGHKLIDLGLGTEDDYTKDKKEELKGNIALISRGAITFTEKVKHAKDNGAVAVIIYNNADGLVSMSLDDKEFPTLGFSKVDGEKLVETAKSGKKVAFDFNMAAINNVEAGRMSDFSSWGPTPELNFKPEISAPGGNIYSLANDNKYQNMSGTSMAAPFVAGSEALILQAIKQKNLNLNGSELVKFAKNSALSTSVPIIDLDHTKEIISPRRQGAGQINVAAAIENNVSLVNKADGNGTITLREIGRSSTFTVTLKNNGSKDETYAFNDYGGVYTQKTDENKEIYDTKIEKASIKTDSNKLTIKAGESKDVTFTVTLPYDFAENQFVEGFVGFDGVNVPNLVIPYMGFFGKYDSGKIIDPLVYEDGHSAPSQSGYLISDNNYVLGIGKDKDGKSNVDPKRIAISPNNKDNVQDYAVPVLYFNKNFNEAKYEIVDDKDKTIRELAIDNSGHKDYYSSGKWSNHTVTEATWSGEVFDKKTGKDTQVKDGQYKYKVTVSPRTGGADQTTYIPITVDNTAPKLDRLSVNKNGNIVFQASDELSGLNEGVVAISLNGQKTTIEVTKKGDTYESVQSFTDYFEKGKNNIELAISDNAGNSTYASTIYETSKDSLLVYNIADGDSINQATAGFNEENKTFEITGSYKENTTIFVNGVETKTDGNGLFKVSIPLTNSTKEVIFSEDKSGEKEISKIAVNVNIVGPEVTVNGLGENSLINTTSDKYTISGNVKDASDVILYNPNTKEQIPVDVDESGNFSKEVKLNYGDNLYYVVASNEVGNETYVGVTINSSGSTSLSSDVLSLDNLDSGLMLINTESKQYDKSAKTLSITGKLAYPVSNFTLNGEQVNYDPNTLQFTYQLKNITTGTYRLQAYVQDDKLNNGRPLVNYSYQIWVDDKLPSLQLKGMEEHNGKLAAYTNSNPYTVKATITDNLSGYNFAINNSHVYSDKAYEVFNEKFFAGKPAVDVNYDVDILEEDTSKMTALLVDELQNKTQLDFTVSHHKKNIEAPSISSSNTEWTNKPLILSSGNYQAVKDAAGNFEKPVLYYSIDNKTWTEVPNDLSVVQNGTYYFQYKDKYGNESSVSTFEVKNIRTAIAGNPTVNLIVDKDKEKVTVELGVDSKDEITKVKYSLDDGKTWQVYDKPFEIKKDTVLRVKTFDKAGNESEVTSTKISIKSTNQKTTPIPKPGGGKAKPVPKPGENGEYKDKDNKEKEEPGSQEPIGIIGNNGSGGSNGNSGKGVNKNNSSSRKNLPSTGEEKALWATVGAGIIALAGGLFYYKRKKDKDESDDDSQK